ncbi:MAG: VOC family protein [Micrococcus sp.]|nr:VOC family protein [Micrococcus sp.]
MTETHPSLRVGAPLWIDYCASDFERQREFYTAIFGWEFDDRGPDFGHYMMISKDGAMVAGAMDAERMVEGTDQEAPPAAWSVYLKTEDIQATVAAAAEHGGQVVVEPMEVGPLGSMAVVMTAGGEPVGFWQPAEFQGHDLPLTVGTSIWFEIMSTNYDADAEFYRQVAGWDVVPMDEPEPSHGEAGPEAGAGARTEAEAGADVGQEDGPRYATNFAGEDASAGLCDAAQWLPKGTPSYWRPYFRVTDADRVCDLVTELGGRVLDGPMDSPFGRVASISDPAGAVFQINQTPAHSPAPIRNSPPFETRARR